MKKKRNLWLALLDKREGLIKRACIYKPRVPYEDRNKQIYDRQVNLIHSQYIHPNLRRLARATVEGARSLMWLGGTRSCKTSSMMQLCGWHATGVYPDGVTTHPKNETPYIYDGHRYMRPVRILVVALTNNMARDILQEYLLKGVTNRPADIITVSSYMAKPGVRGLYEKIRVPHFTSGVYDGESEIIFKSGEEGAQKFQGYNDIDCIFMDEEPNYNVFKECRNRLAVTNENKKTFLFLSQWPVNGKSEVVNFFYQNKEKNKVCDYTFYTQSGWRQNPFIPAEEIEVMKLDYPAWALPARMDGVPTFGRGKVFGFLLTDASNIIVDDIDFNSIPNNWNLIGGVDPSATSNGTWGACLLAEDPTTRSKNISSTEDPTINIGTVYMIRDYLVTDKVLNEHGTNLRTLFNHLPGIPLVCDPAGGGESAERQSALEYLRDTEKLNVLTAEKVNQAKNRAIQKIWMLHSRGKFKICRGCVNALAQFEQYARDEDGQIIKKDDHIIDACFYALNKIDNACCKNDLFCSCVNYSPVRNKMRYNKIYD